MSRLLIDLLVHLVLPASAVLAHLVASPYTKVEESFTLQATHDILRHGLPTTNTTAVLKAHYDHFSFPGAVPRSFVGPLVLAGISKPFIAVFGGLVNEQVVVRGVLGLWTALALSFFSYRARRAYGRTAARFYVILQLSQFHLLYYASRTLPNTFALQLSLLAQGLLLPAPGAAPATQHIYQKLGIYVLVLGGIIFRSELALLLFFRSLHLVLNQRAGLFKTVIPAGIAGGVVGLTLTLGIDSYFWQSYTPGTHFTTPFLTEKFGLIWPEFSAFWYNAIGGHASDWGTSPWHHYFTAALPKLLLNPISIPAILFATTVVPPRTSIQLAVPNIFFAAAYSFLPHKEWRFVVYTVPELTLLAAIGITWAWTRSGKHPLYTLLSLGLLASIPVTATIAAGMLAISAMNYPGGAAMSALHTNLPSGFSGTIHLDVPVCMTGATRFLMEAPLLPHGRAVASASLERFDKTEDEEKLLRPEFWDSMDYVVVSQPGKPIGAYEVLQAIPGFKRIKIYKPGEKVRAVVSAAQAATEEAGLAGEESSERGVWQRALEDGYGLRALLRGWWVGIEREEMVFIMKRQAEAMKRISPRRGKEISLSEWNSA